MHDRRRLSSAGFADRHFFLMTDQLMIVLLLLQLGELGFSEERVLDRMRRTWMFGPKLQAAQSLTQYRNS
jgi:hypothetical protein